jgi:hypothetical protein
VRDSVRLVDRDSTRSAALGELETEPALPKPGVGDHSDYLTAPRDRVPERRRESRHLVGAPDEP